MRDMDIREALERELRLAHGNDPDTLILHELGLCQGMSRVDMAVVNGEITGYEIKSPKDTLERLAFQKEVYSKTLDRVIIIAGEAHLDHVREMVPEWWGISVPVQGDDGISILVERPPQSNPSIDPHALVQLLWREEALEELCRLGMERGVLSKPRAVIWARLADAVPVEELAAIVRARIKARKNWRVDRSEM